MNEITHERAREYIHQGQNGLSDSDKDMLITHLSKCNDCREYATLQASLAPVISNGMHTRWDKYSPRLSDRNNILSGVKRKIRIRSSLNYANISLLVAVIILGIIGIMKWALPESPLMPASIKSAPTAVPTKSMILEATASPTVQATPSRQAIFINTPTPQQGTVEENTVSPGSQAPISTPDPQLPLPTPGINGMVVGKLMLEEWVIVPATTDTPIHPEFKRRIPEKVWARRRETREIPASDMLLETNKWLDRFGYRMESRSTKGTEAPEYAIYHANLLVRDRISQFYPISISGSGKDFALVVQETNGYSLIRNGSVEPWDFTLHGFTTPVFVGDSLTFVDYDSNSSEVVLWKNGEITYRYTISDPIVGNPTISLYSWEGKWALKVGDEVLINGISLNDELGYDAVIHWQLLDGKPFYIFRKEGKIRLSYEGQTLPYQPPYDEVIHDRCCEAAEFNVSGNPHMVWFYARRNGWWNYVEIGNWW